MKQGQQALQQEQKKQGSKLTRVQKDITLILKYHDENVLMLRKRIERIEDHLKLKLAGANMTHIQQAIENRG